MENYYQKRDNMTKMKKAIAKNLVVILPLLNWKRIYIGKWVNYFWLQPYVFYL